MDELKSLREQINLIDGWMANLFEQRMALCERVGEIKAREGLPILDQAREQSILQKNRVSPALAPYYRQWMRTTMALSKSLQEKNRAEQALPSGVWMKQIVLQAASCPVYLRRGALNLAQELLDLERKVLIITDIGVPEEYVERLSAQCKAVISLALERGEASKSTEMAEGCYQLLKHMEFTKGDCIIALGGGAICDLAGFVAATYLRGIDCYMIPTTLLAQVDASIGGKTAINYEQVKNRIGVIRQPKAVLIDPDLLATLPDRLMAEGKAEMLKIGLVRSRMIYEIFRDGKEDEYLETAIRQAIYEKIALVEQDEQDQGVRRLLNFGHTIGHGIEAAAQGELYHGECVALGMLPFCGAELRGEVAEILRRIGLPIRCTVSKETIFRAMKQDKKRNQERYTVVRCDQPGQGYLEEMQEQQLWAVLRKAWQQ